MIERDEKLIAEVRSFVPELEVVPDEVVESLWAQWSDKEYCAGWMYPDGPLAMKFRKHYLDHPAVEVLLEHVKEAEWRCVKCDQGKSARAHSIFPGR